MDLGVNLNPINRYVDSVSAVFEQRPNLPGQAGSDPGQSNGVDTRLGAQGDAKPQALLQSKVPTAPSIALPKGGGAIRGIGEKFSVNASNGTGNLSIPIAVSPGRSGMQPNLSLSYDSGSGNGEFGLGWRLSGVESITRKTSKGLPRYNDHGNDKDSDVFLLAGAEDLVPAWKQNEMGEVLFDGYGQPIMDETVVDGHTVRAYSPRIVFAFNRIERWSNLSDREDIHWRVISTENVTAIFGASDSSRIYDPDTSTTGESRRIFSWLQTERYDAHGNAMTFTYKREDSSNLVLTQSHELNRSDQSRSANLYLKAIRYGNVVPNRDSKTWEAFPASSLSQDWKIWKFSVILDYGEHSHENPKPDDAGSWSCRRDPFSRYNAGFEIRTYRLCRRVLVFHHFDELGVPDFLVSSLDLTYEDNPTTSYLVSAQMAGYSSRAGVATAPLRKCMPPMEFEYSRFPAKDDLAKLEIEHVDPSSIENLPVGLDGKDYRWVDLDGEGLSGVLAVHGNAWYYKRNTSASNYSETSSVDEKLAARLAPMEVVKLGPFLGASELNMQFGDVNGNGRLDLISRVAGQWGYFERDNGETLGWTEFRPFRSFPSLSSESRMQFIDLTGDGLADILINEDQVYMWFASKGSDGYDAPQTLTQDWDEAKGPICVFADSEQRIYLADMSGDGMLDLCRVRNGDCCYWPQLGYGRFGSQISFDNAPWSDCYDQFHNHRLRLVDFDGSGTADIMYLTNDGVDLYLNESGNSFSEKRKIPFPSVNQSTNVDVVDLLGNGTQCLVWSSPLAHTAQNPMAYVDVFKNKKPHLLTGIKNNLGSETRIYYAPSTKFYLDDKNNGRPWITTLNFPISCVERVETIDHVTGNVFTAGYQYAHGFYDGVEREFRGFARVEQVDSTKFSSLERQLPTNLNPSWTVPPVRTMTWFHTGAYFDRETMSELLSKEYFGSSDDVSGLSPVSIPLSPTAVPVECVEGTQKIEACRALKGKTLRTEIYSDDGTDKAHVPYSVEETNCIIVPRQVAQDSHSHGVYFVHNRETVSISYEREVKDPRVAHQMVLELDSFGNPLKELRISYGRQLGQSQLGPEDAAKQETTFILYNEGDFTNSLGGKAFRAPVACESRQYEISGLKPETTGARFKYESMVADEFAAILAIPKVQPEDDVNQNSAFRRLLRRERALFRSDDLSAQLPVGSIQSLGLPDAYHKLAFTPGLFTKLFSKTQLDGTLQLLISTSEALDSKGYINLDGDGNLWTATSKASYATDPVFSSPSQELDEGRNNFFLAKTLIDEFGSHSYVDYDLYHLFPTSSRDVMGNTVHAVTDYRTLQPKIVVDPNGNTTSAAYDALGMVAGVAVSGKPSDNLGDTLENFEADVAQESLDRFIESPTTPAAEALLGNATSRILHDPWRMRSTSTPILAVMISRETHVNHPAPPGGRLFQVHISYSDGFGRVVQQKVRTSAGPVVDGGISVSDRWIGTGWTLFNNKGKPVKQFEPFFDTTASFQPDLKVGVASTLLYDPMERVVAVLRPDHTFEKTVYSPWHQQTFDPNDNVLRSDPRQDPHVGALFSSLLQDEFLPSWYEVRRNGQRGRAEREAALKAADHNDTPKTLHLDGLGRAFLTITDIGMEKIAISAEMDALGNMRSVRDPLLRKSVVADFDLCQRQCHTCTIDSGDLWALFNGVDQKCMTWNARDFRTRLEYDKLRRQTQSWWRDAGTAAEVLTTHIVYGEDFTSDDNESAETHNIRGKVWKISDQSGLVTNSDFDCDGNLTSSKKVLSAEYKKTFDVSSEMHLETEEHVKTSTFDLLHRSTRSVAPDGTVTVRVYGQSTHLDRMYVNTKGEHDAESELSTWTQPLTDSQHNAKGQLVGVSYGNGTTTNRTYDKSTFRLARLRTIRARDGQAVQDLAYTYDAVGNISRIQDAAQQTIFFRNAVVEPSNDYIYDAAYRLISASGREHLGQTNGRPDSPTAPNGSDDTHNTLGDQGGNGQVMGLYTENYKYDLAGNILSVRHVGSDTQSPGWTRTYSYNEDGMIDRMAKSNRLSQTSVGSATEVYRYNGSAGSTGNMTSMAHLPSMTWDFADRLSSTSKQTVAPGSGQIPETTYYVYDWQGQRVRKVTESQAGPNSQPIPVRLQERLYLDTYEIFRRYTGGGDGDNGGSLTPSLERTTFHVGTEYGHVVDICSRTIGDDDGTARQIRFQLHNHLGSAVLELDDAGELLSYEEFFPFGSTSYKAVPGSAGVAAAKRYRFSGKELDDENGLYYFGARYLAAWLGRWTAADPVVGPESRYDYAANNPVKLVDPDGRQPTPWTDVGSDSVLGPLAHTVVGEFIKARLQLRGIQSITELRTLPGGSKKNPFDLRYTGEIDLTVLEHKVPFGGDKWIAHNYEFKPDTQTSNLTDYQSYKYQSETQLYSKYTPRVLPNGMGEVVEARPGAIIENIDYMERMAGVPEKFRLLAPIEFSTPAFNVRINLRLQDSGAGGKVRGEVLYQIQLQVKDPNGLKDLAKEALKYFIAYGLAQQVKNIVNAPQGQGTTQGQGQGQSQPQPQGVPVWVKVTGGVALVAAGVAVVYLSGGTALAVLGGGGTATGGTALAVGGSGAATVGTTGAAGGFGALLSWMGMGTMTAATAGAVLMVNQPAKPGAQQ